MLFKNCRKRTALGKLKIACAKYCIDNIEAKSNDSIAFICDVCGDVFYMTPYSVFYRNKWCHSCFKAGKLANSRPRGSSRWQTNNESKELYTTNYVQNLIKNCDRSNQFNSWDPDQSPSYPEPPTGHPPINVKSGYPIPDRSFEQYNGNSNSINNQKSYESHDNSRQQSTVIEYNPLSDDGELIYLNEYEIIRNNPISVFCTRCNRTHWVLKTTLLLNPYGRTCDCNF